MPKPIKGENEAIEMTTNALSMVRRLVAQYGSMGPVFMDEIESLKRAENELMNVRVLQSGS